MRNRPALYVIYEQRSEVQSFRSRIRVLEVWDGAKIVSVGVERDGKVATDMKVEVSSGGLSRIWIQGKLDDPPECWLKLPLKEASEWDVCPDRHVVGRAKLRAFGPGEVRVPAGTYRAIRVEITWPDRDFGFGPVRSTRWFAPGVGIIKLKSNNREAVLKSFTPGKD